MTSDHGGGSITSVLQETRVFTPPPEFASKATISSLAQYEALWNAPRTIRRVSGASKLRIWIGTGPGTKCWTAAAMGQVVPRGPAQCLVQLRRPPLRGS